MNRATFLRRALLTVGALSLGRLPAAPAAPAAVAPTVVFLGGTWELLDGGTLELGVIRDSLLTTTNDFQIFAETNERVGFVGRVRSALLPG